MNLDFHQYCNRFKNIILMRVYFFLFSYTLLKLKVQCTESLLQGSFLQWYKQVDSSIHTTELAYFFGTHDYRKSYVYLHAWSIQIFRIFLQDDSGGVSLSFIMRNFDQKKSCAITKKISTITKINKHFNVPMFLKFSDFAIRVQIHFNFNLF